MNGNPKVSVIIPCYNTAHYLEECLESIASSTLREIEIIVINDGSTDDSIDIIRGYAGRDHRFLVIDRENKGFSATLNEGIRAASGKYLAFLDSDDYIDVRFLKTAYEAAEKYGLDLATANHINFTGSSYFSNLKSSYETCVINTALYNRVITGRDNVAFQRFNQMWATLYRMDLIRNNEIYMNENVASCSDNGFVFQTILCAQKIMYLNCISIYHRKDNENSLTANAGLMMTDYIAEFSHVKQSLIKRELWPEYKEIVIERFIWNCYTALSVIPFAAQMDFILNVSGIIRLELESDNYREENFLSSSGYRNVFSCAYLPYEYYKQYLEQKYKVSVIIPVYNAEPFIRATLDSVIAQTLKEIEIILVDDGSTDGSFDILNEYAENDGRITVLTQINQGAGAARNYGMKAAHGKYLSFLDADDYFYPDMLKDSFEHANKNNADITVFMAEDYFVNKDKTVMLNKFFFDDGNALPSNKPVFSIKDIKANPFTSVATWAFDKLFLRSFIQRNNIKFQPLMVSNDVYFTLTALMKASRINTLNRVFVKRNRDHGANISSNLHDIYPLNQIEMLRGVYAQARKLGYAKQITVFCLEKLFWQIDTPVTNEESAAAVFDEWVGGLFDELGIYELEEADVPKGSLEKYLFFKRAAEYKPGQYFEFKDSLANYPIIITNPINKQERELSFCPGRKNYGKIFFTLEEKHKDLRTVPFFSLTLPEAVYSNCIAKIEFVFLANNQPAVYDTLYLGVVNRAVENQSMLYIYQSEWEYARRELSNYIYISTQNNTLTFHCRYASRSSGFEYHLLSLSSREGNGCNVILRHINNGFIQTSAGKPPVDAAIIETCLNNAAIENYDPQISFSNAHYGSRVIFKCESTRDTAAALFKITLDEFNFNNASVSIDFTMLKNLKANVYDTLRLSVYLKMNEETGNLDLLTAQAEWDKDTELNKNIFYVTEDNSITVYGKYTEKHTGYHFAVISLTNRGQLREDNRYSLKFDILASEFWYKELQKVPLNAVFITNEEALTIPDVAVYKEILSRITSLENENEKLKAELRNITTKEQSENERQNPKDEATSNEIIPTVNISKVPKKRRNNNTAKSSITL